MIKFSSKWLISLLLVATLGTGCSFSRQPHLDVEPTTAESSEASIVETAFVIPNHQYKRICTLPYHNEAHRNG